MRKPSQSADVVTVAPRQASYGRRPLAPLFGHLTCLVLVKHGETEKALLVSDDGDAVGAVWVPKVVLIIEPGERGRFIIATISKAITAQKRLDCRFIDPARFLAEEITVLQEAKMLAARSRNRLRGHRDALPYPGRNAFA